MHEVHIKSHITKFYFIINDLDKIEIKIEDKNQALLLLCSLPSSYKSFRKTITYGGKSTIKVNEVKEHLLKKDKIDTRLTGGLIKMTPGKFIIRERRVIMEVPRATQNIRV